MSEGKYVAYLGSYTHGKAKGITICDVDMEKGVFIPRKEVEVGNPSYLRIANNGKFLYSVSDLGISSFKILEDGDLEFVNLGSINGMRACHISVDRQDKFIFTAGYHDGKASVVRINDDGSVGELTSEVYHKGLGSIAERNSRPHITCTRLTPDGKYLVACDVGIDQVKLYSFDRATKKVKIENKAYTVSLKVKEALCIGINISTFVIFLISCSTRIISTCAIYKNITGTKVGKHIFSHVQADFLIKHVTGVCLSHATLCIDFISKALCGIVI